MRTLRIVLFTLAFSGLGACNLYFGDHTSNSTGFDAGWGTPDGNDPHTCGDGGLPPPDAFPPWQWPDAAVEPDAAYGPWPDAAPWSDDGGVPPDAPPGGDMDGGCHGGTPDAGLPTPDAGPGGGYDDAGPGGGTDDGGLPIDAAGKPDAHCC
jgi:hypothetical protein